MDRFTGFFFDTANPFNREARGFVDPDYKPLKEGVDFFLGVDNQTDKAVRGLLMGR